MGSGSHDRPGISGLEAGRVDGTDSWDGYAATAVAEAAIRSYTVGERVPVQLVGRPALYS